ncbi:MAG TPA: endonuclease domain-containing protein [Bacillota bacterium]|nr:endonuclease domain-containing protein [Bacillota bacterium]
MRGTERLKTYARAHRKEPTEAEKRFWGAVRGNELDGLKFYRERVMWKFIADFYCAELKLVVEIDGPIHDSPERQAYDRMREDVFRRNGLTVIRFKNEQVLLALDECLEEIRKIAKAKKGLVGKASEG